MKCRDAVRHVLTKQDVGVLQDMGAVDFAQHMEACPRCAAWLRAYLTELHLRIELLAPRTQAS